MTTDSKHAVSVLSLMNKFYDLAWLRRAKRFHGLKPSFILLRDKPYIAMDAIDIYTVILCRILTELGQ